MYFFLDENYINCPSFRQINQVKNRASLMTVVRCLLEYLRERKKHQKLEIFVSVLLGIYNSVRCQQNTSFIWSDSSQRFKIRKIFILDHANFSLFIFSFILNLIKSCIQKHVEGFESFFFVLLNIFVVLN